MNEPWRITLFGGLSAQQADKTITRFKSQKIAALLAYLALHLRQTHSREFLIELLWPEGTLEAGRNSLSVALSSLRHQFEPPGTPANSVIRADRFSVGLNPAALTTDASEFEDAVRASVRVQDERERQQHLARALALYQGSLLPHLYDEWIAGEQQRLALLFFDGAARLIRGLEDAGEVQSALVYARRAASLDPLREEAQHTLIRLLDAASQPGAALQQFKEYERLLEEQMADEPGAALRTLARQIEKRLGLSAALLPIPALPPPAPAASRSVTLGGATTVTFLMTDIEGSTRVWEKSGEAYKQALQQHHRLLREQFERHGGKEIKEAGDGFIVAFAGAVPALRCAADAQQCLSIQPWPPSVGPLVVRMALHTGDVEQSEGGDYQGLVLHRASRILGAAHGGQTLLSEVTASLVRRDLPADIHLLDLGVYRLRDLPSPERLFQVEHPGMAQTAFPPLRAPAGHGEAGIPLTFTRFFGREQELARLEQLLKPSTDVRLVTVLGPGGTGKTRLAIEASRRALDPFGGAVWFVPLADISNPALIAGAILDALRVPRSPRQEPLDQLVEHLSRPQPSLVVLDNFEHLVEGGGPEAVQTLLERVPMLTILVTSRQVLGLSAEREFVLSPLPTPHSGEDAAGLSAFDSVQLFIDRAQQVLPDFQVTNYNAAAVAELVTRLEGIPLAIELAAARALVLTPSQMLAQVENRFDFLAGRKRDVVERHRTLRTAVDWSYQLLTPELRRLFCRLSVFRGGWTVEAAESVCEEPLALDHLAQLGECSLVLSEETEHGMRFRMLETLREFGWEQLRPEERTNLAWHHANYCLTLAQQGRQAIQSPIAAVWLARLERENDNFRAALRHCQDTEDGAETELLLTGSLAIFWLMRGYWVEGEEYFAHALRRDDARRTATLEPPTEGRRCALSGGGILLVHYEPAKARAYLEEFRALTHSTDRKSDIANTVCLLAYARELQGDIDAARTLYEESLSLYDEADERWHLGNPLLGLAKLAVLRKDYADARRLFEESLAASRAVGNSCAGAIVLYVFGTFLVGQGDFATAREHAMQALILSRALGDKGNIINSLLVLGEANAKLGNAEAARENHEELLQIQRDCAPVLYWMYSRIGDAAIDVGDNARAHTMYVDCLRLLEPEGPHVHAPYVMRRLSQLAAAKGDYRREAQLLSAAVALRAKMDHVQVYNGQNVHFDGADTALRRDALRESLGGEAFTIAWAEGQQTGWEEAVALALGETRPETTAEES